MEIKDQKQQRNQALKKVLCFLQAKQMKGWLKKKSPKSIISIWQKRYWVVHSNGTLLSYFEGNQQNSRKLGTINIKNISSIDQQKDLIFIINYETRKFYLQAISKQLRNQWKQALQILKSNSQQKIQHSHSISLNKQYYQQEKIQTKSWKNSVELVTLNSVMENAKFQQSWVKKQNSSPSQQNITYQNLIEKLCLKKYFNRFPPQVIKNRFLFGHIEKRKKTGVKLYKTKIFFLISAKSLSPKMYKDQIILHQTDLPTWMFLDTLYSVKPGSQLKPKQIGIMCKCVQIELKDMTKSKDPGFTLRINFGQTIVQIMLRSQQQRLNWSSCLKQSMKTAKQIYNRKNTVIIKNIDILIDKYDSFFSLIQKKQNIRKKFQQDLQKNYGQYVFDENVNSFIEWIQILMEQINHMINACLAKSIKRTDIIKEYIDFIHQKIVKNLIHFWDTNYKKLTTADFMSLVNILESYSNNFKLYLIDNRMQATIKTLVKIFFTQSKQNIQQILQNIVHQQKINNPQQIDELLMTNSPNAMFRILHSLLNKIRSENKQICIMLAIYSKKLIKFFQNMLEELLDDVVLSNNQLVSIYNNTIDYLKYTQQYKNKLSTQIKLTQAQIEKNFDTMSIKKGWINIANTSKYYIELGFYGNMKNNFLGQHYLEFNIQKIFQLIAQNNHKIDMLHESFKKKIYQDILKQICNIIFIILVNSSTKMKKVQVDSSNQQSNYITKLREDNQNIKQQFENILAQSKIKNILKCLQYIVCFIIQDSALLIPKYCTQLRNSFGNLFNQKACVINRNQKNLISLKTNLTKEQISQITNNCFSILQKYSSQNSNQKKKIITQSVQSQQENEESQKKSIIFQKPRRKSVSLQQDQFNDTGIQLVQFNQQQKTDNKSISQGYLYKKKISKTRFFQKRFFRIRQGFLYWYISPTARQFQNKIELSKIEQVVNAQKQEFHIILQDKKKNYQLKAQSPYLAQLWVKSLKKEIERITKEQQVQINQIIQEGTQSYCKDYFEIQRKEKQLKKKMQKKKKLQQKIIKKKQTKESQIILKMQRTNFDSKSKDISKSLLQKKTNQSNGCCYAFWSCLGLQQ